jgi:hypothetical protein
VTLIRKPALYWLVLACTAALTAGGRLSLRLLLDTAVVLAPIVLFQCVALAVVYWTGKRPLPCAPVVDGYFAGSGPWFFALTVLAAFGCAASPPLASRWFARINAILFLLAIVLSLRIDFRYSRHVLMRTTRRAIGDLVTYRALAWSATVLYFLWTASDKASQALHDVIQVLAS